MKKEELTKYDKIFLAISELPRKMQIQLILSVGKDKKLDYEVAHNVFYALLYKSSLSKSDKQRLLGHRNWVLKSKLVMYYRENKKYTQSKLKKMLKFGCLSPVFLEDLEFHI